MSRVETIAVFFDFFVGGFFFLEFLFREVRLEGLPTTTMGTIVSKQMIAPRTSGGDCLRAHSASSINSEESVVIQGIVPVNPIGRKRRTLKPREVAIGLWESGDAFY